MHVRNPVEWGVDQVRLTGSALGRTMDHRHKAAVPEIRRISLSDIRHALARGVDDFGAFRSDVVFLAIIYPLFGLLLLAIFAVWIGVASAIYDLTLGPEPPISAVAFLRDVFTTEMGWTMMG